MAKAKRIHSNGLSTLTTNSLTFLKKYLNTPSPVGFESEGQKIWINYLKPYIDTYFTDAYGTGVGVINPEAKFRVVIEAHADEISWFVNYINPEGLMYLKRNGGVDHQVAPGQRVIIHSTKGSVKAVFGWPAIHTRLGTDAKEVHPKVENLFLDCGARNRKDVEALGIHPGSVVTYQDGFDELAYDTFIARAFDNRIGGFMIAEVARLLKENKKKLPYGLYIVNAVQEEVGLRGAEMIARDTATPMVNKLVEGDITCGKGPSLAFGPAVHNLLLSFVRNTAAKKNIPVQLRAVSRSTGTDTDSFAYANEGCPSVLISIPLRYMHTTVEMLNRKDIEQTIQLMYETLLALSPKTNLNYHL
jgi:putative aminopeptidase FrvX